MTSSIPKYLIAENEASEFGQLPVLKNGINL